MGKKSRMKRERRERKTVENQFMAMLSQLTVNPDAIVDNEAFGKKIDGLSAIFSKFNAESVCLALGVSSLWLPNISAQLKHSFAFSVFLSISQNQFNVSKNIDTYVDFCSFLNDVYKILPSFYMFEDYVPEMDWGDIRVESQASNLYLFYGNSIEMIPDYIKSFQLCLHDELSALSDLHTAIEMQDYIISGINKSLVGYDRNVDPGYIEVPSESFWRECVARIKELSDHFSFSIISEDLIVQQGDFSFPNTSGAFCDRFMTGCALPFLFVELDTKKYPLIIRDSIGVVISHWAKLFEKSRVNKISSLSSQLNGYLSNRIYFKDIKNGVFKVLNKNRKSSGDFLAVIFSGESLYFLMILERSDIKSLVEIEKEFYDIISGKENWGIQYENKLPAIKFENKLGKCPNVDVVKLIMVLPHFSPDMMQASYSSAVKSSVLWLPHFITLFDSLNNTKELDSFFYFLNNNKSLLGGYGYSIPDAFAAFKDSCGLLVDGAINVSGVFVDPHWGSNFRFKKLKEFWSSAPLLFPTNDVYQWRIDDNIQPQLLMSRGLPILARSIQISNCSLHFVLYFDKKLDIFNGQLLTTFLHCVSDALIQRREIVEGIGIFRKKLIKTICVVDYDFLGSEELDIEDYKLFAPLFTGWISPENIDSKEIIIPMRINLARFQNSLNCPSDATGEVDCVASWIKKTCEVLQEELSDEVLFRLDESKSRQPRFFMQQIDRKIDVPSFVEPKVPSSEHYKLARKKLALIFNELNIEPKKYELQDAKEILNIVIEKFRKNIHLMIKSYEHDDLLTFIVEQVNALSAEYIHKFFKIKQSMAHEVDYNRAEHLSDVSNKHSNEGRNYRYLLESCLSLGCSDKLLPSEQKILELLASIDWLFVLYSASDTLHYDLEVAGIFLNHDYIPEVFYSPDGEEKRKIFDIEQSSIKLGLKSNPNDEVSSPQASGEQWDILDKSFRQDISFSFTGLTHVLVALSRWQTIRGLQATSLSYQATYQELLDVLEPVVQDVSIQEIKNIIEFITLNPQRIKILLGSDEQQDDIPVWEHNKRGERYTIKPLLRLRNGNFIWGAATAERAFSVWMTAISNGYLPASYDWKNVEISVRKIKEGLESALEKKAIEICEKITPYTKGNLYPHKLRQGFNNVGDFDVLAYWPDTNQWLVVECKYNQPPFCAKDMKRLRERIFGRDNLDHGQFSKIENRRKFLQENLEKLRCILNWPAPAIDSELIMLEVYISRDTYWWMRNPPYDVPTHFVRIDALEKWLKDESWRYN